nr:MAG TPA: hypothetical protein [Caudoviricetes sp.]
MDRTGAHYRPLYLLLFLYLCERSKRGCKGK